ENPARLPAHRRVRASTTMGDNAVAAAASSTDRDRVVPFLRSILCSYVRLSPYRMRTVWRPSGRPTRVNDPVESLTLMTRLPLTAIITPETGRPLMDDRTVPVSRAVVSRWA